MKSFLLFFISLNLLASPIFEESFVSPTGLNPAHHGSAIVSLPDKNLLACWYSGDHEGAKDVQIYCSRSGSEGKVWGTPRVVVAKGEYPRGSWFSNKTVGNVALYLDEENKLWMFYSAVVFGGWSGSHVDYKVSSDFGRTWGRSERYVGTFGNLPRNKPIKISRNKFFLPLYHEFTKFQGYGCLVEHAQGKITKSRCYNIPGSKHGQPTFIKADEKRVFAYLRTKGMGKAYFSVFNLDTKKWSQPQALALPNSDSALDALMTRSGVLMVYNNSTTSRIPLSLGVSNDGLQFQPVFDFETQVDASYPCIIQEGDEYYVTYTYNGRSGIKFVHFNQEWLSQKINK